MMSGHFIIGESYRTAAACCLVVMLSGVLRGFAGYGFALAASPLLALLMAPRDAVPVVLMLQLGSSLLGLKQSLARWDPRPSLLIATAAIATTPLGVLLLGVMSADTARIGMAIVTFSAVLVLSNPRLELNLAGRWKPLPFGLVAGLLGGASAMPGPPVLTYFIASKTPAGTARASMNLIFMATSTAALLGAIWSGIVGPRALWITVLCLPAMIVGTFLGARAFERASATIYKRVGLVSLTGIAIAAFVRALLW